MLSNEQSQKLARLYEQSMNEYKNKPHINEYMDGFYCGLSDGFKLALKFLQDAQTRIELE